VKATWSGGALGGTDFPDAFAVAMPVKGKPALALMGSVDAPIYILRWQANKEGVQLVSATGIGQSAPGAQIKAGVQVRKVGDEWSVVITRALGAGQGVAPLQAGKKTQIGFAVWNGGNDERAGIKAFSIDWAELVLDA
jgi:DMSO reductase family type II enzyme heme b subunit